MRPVALTIAGSDPSGGAGVQADLKTFHQFGVYGAAALTLITVQNTERVSRVETLDPELVLAQIDAVTEDLRVAAAKTGALGDVPVVRGLAAIAGSLTFPLVVDPVILSKHGSPLLSDAAVHALRDELLPHVFLVTPNLPEAEVLAGISIRSHDEMLLAARQIQALGCRNVVVKGGHALEDADDLLLLQNGDVHWLRGTRVPTKQTHGTGCTFSAAITACLARGFDLVAAVNRAKRFIQAAIESAPGLGHGHGPVNHFASTSEDEFGR